MSNKIEKITYDCAEVINDIRREHYLSVDQSMSLNKNIGKVFLKYYCKEFLIKMQEIDVNIREGEIKIILEDLMQDVLKESMDYFNRSSSIKIKLAEKWMADQIIED